MRWRNGTLYIAQSGKGGTDPNLCRTGPEGDTVCFGTTGKILSLDVSSGGSVADLVTGLPSIAEQLTGDSAIGPSDVAIDGIGQVWATIGLGGDPSVICADFGNSPAANLLGTEGKVKGDTFVMRGDPAACEEAGKPRRGYRSERQSGS